MLPADAPYWLAWIRIKGMGPHRIKRLYQHFGSLQSAWAADPLDLTAVEGISGALASQIQQQRRALDPLEVLQQVEKPGIPFLTPASDSYPPLLWELPDPPPILYLLGDVPRWDPAVAIVGTRNPTAYGRRWTERVATALAEAGFLVVSGMADGIDGVAHQACLKAGGKTVAVVGTGVDVIYPAKHHNLYQRIRSEGAILSEFAPGTQPAKENFPRRNRIIAGLCKATLLMEAPEKSGGLITAYLANDYNRDVFALPGNIDTPEARGCLKLIQTGAALILGIDELLAALGSPVLVGDHQAPAQPDPPEPDLAGSQLVIWQALTDQPQSLDTLAVVTQLDINILSSDLLMLELVGCVVQLPGMRYQRARDW